MAQYLQNEPCPYKHNGRTPQDFIKYNLALVQHGDKPKKKSLAVGRNLFAATSASAGNG